MPASDNFTNNYKILEEISEKLSNDENINLDELVPLIDQATQAYKNCKTRLESLETIINNKLSNFNDKPESQQQNQQQLQNNTTTEVKTTPNNDSLPF